MKTGWLSPTGDFTEAHNCEHIFYARKILHKLDKEMVAGRPDDIFTFSWLCSYYHFFAVYEMFSHKLGKTSHS